MAHHKRKRPANRRAGCKLCKPWKINGISVEMPGGESHSNQKRRWGIDRDARDNPNGGDE